jgi:rare lipoprotein A
LPRSTMRRAARAGALCLTATTTAAVPAAAQTDGVDLGTKRLDVRVGGRITVSGHARSGAVAALQVRRRGHWATLDRARMSPTGRFVLRRRFRAPESAPARVRLSTGAARRLGRVNAYRYAAASWYGPGLYGNHLGCGGTLQPDRLGVAHKSLPCGAKVTLRHAGRVVRVRVIDRGPYVGGREFDLTAATASRLQFSGHGAIQVAR